MSEFAKNEESDLAEITDANACAGFSSCPEGDQMPMTAGHFNAAFKWTCDKIEDLRETLCLKVDNLQACFDALTGANIGAGLGLFSSRVGKTLEFRSITAGKGITAASTGTEILVTSTAYCCYSEANIPAGPPPAGFIASTLVDDCTDPQSPIVYIWSCKAGAYFPLTAPNAENEAPPCSVHPAQTASIGDDFSYDASETDPEGDALTYTAAAPAWPAGFVIDATTGEITAPALTGPAGMYVLNWTIDDGTNPPTACSLSLTIAEALTCTGPITADCTNVGTAAEPNINCGVGAPHNNTTTETICGHQIIAFNSGEGGPGPRGTTVTLQSATPLTQASITSFNGVLTSSADNFTVSGNQYTWKWFADVFGMGGGNLAGQPFTVCYECPADSGGGNGGGTSTACDGSISCTGESALSGNPSVTWYGTGSVPGSVPADALGLCSGDIEGVQIDAAIQKGSSFITLTITGTIPADWDSLIYSGAAFPPPAIVGTIDLSGYGNLTGTATIPLTDTNLTAADWATVLGGSHSITATCS